MKHGRTPTPSRSGGLSTIHSMLIATAFFFAAAFSVSCAGPISSEPTTPKSPDVDVDTTAAEPAIPPATSPWSVDDESIKIELMHRYLVEGIPSHNIDVTVKDGIVILSGSTRNIRSRKRILNLPRYIKGVKAVIDRVSVKPVLRPDDELEADIREALDQDPVLKNYDIEPKANGGIVSLEGTCSSYEQKTLSEDIVSSVRGVAEIKNNIEIEYAKERTDKEIKKDVISRLRSDIRIEDVLIDVEVDDGHVFLRGTVSSAAEKNLAYINSWVLGTKKVSSEELEVSWKLRDEMRRKSTPVLDSETIKQSLQAALSYDPLVDGDNINVKVSEGVVTIYGNTENLRAKQSAERNAENTTGVVDVKNLINVRPAKTISNGALRDLVRRVIQSDSTLSRFQISVSAFDGKVYLDGTVPSAFDKKAAERTVGRITGVQAVGNNLSVRSEVHEVEPDWKVSKAIMERLFWNPTLDSRKIIAEVEGGVAILRGEVDNWRERVIAESEAYKAGAWRVRNLLRIKPLRYEENKDSQIEIK